MTTAATIVLVVVLLSICGGVFGIRRGIDRRARGGFGDDENVTRDYQKISRDIDRGRSAGHGGWPI